MVSVVTTPARSPVRRGRDSYGLTLSTTPDAAAAYQLALDRHLSLESGVEEGLEWALHLDPSFALGHAVLATVLAEAGAPLSEVREHLHLARRWASAATDREGSFVTAAVLWCSAGLSGDETLLRHVQRWPSDAYAVSLLTPSIASAGVADGVVEVWPLLDELSRFYGRDWWLTSIRSFARTEQHRWSEAEDLALAALAVKPESGHAAHAMAHVFYETGRHRDGIHWIDQWKQTDGRNQRFSGHFSWHAALCQLALGDADGVRARFDRELAGLRGNRALVDAGSLLVRCAAHGSPIGRDRARARRVAEVAADAVVAPRTPFLAWHAAVLAHLCADEELLSRCSEHSRVWADKSRSDPPERLAWQQVGSVCRALHAAGHEDPARAAALLSSLGDTAPMGGSPAQRELLDDLAICALVAAGEPDAAARVAAARLSRRPCAFDERVVAGAASRLA